MRKHENFRFLELTHTASRTLKAHGEVGRNHLVGFPLRVVNMSERVHDSLISWSAEWERVAARQLAAQRVLEEMRYDAVQRNTA